MIKGSAYLHYSIYITFLTYNILTQITLFLDHHRLTPDFSYVANGNSYLYKWLRALYIYEKLLT